MEKILSRFILKNTALIIVDVQNDFLELGNLSVPQSNKIIPLVNQLQNYFEYIVATKDWHCENHVSFLSDVNDKGWPKHCIRNTWGAEFPKDLNVEKIRKIFLKGQDRNCDSYSGFYNDFSKKRPTGLFNYLKSKLVYTVFVVGLTLDFCVRETIIDAYNLGFQSYLVIDATKSISPFPEIIIKELKKFGILICSSKDILKGVGFYFSGS